MNIREIDFKNSLFISIFIHFLLFLVFSILFMKNPFQRVELPTVVNIEFNAETVGEGINENIKSPPLQTRTPSLEQRKSVVTERTVVKEKAILAKELVRKIKEISKENVKELVPRKDVIEKKVKENVNKQTEKIVKDVVRDEKVEDNVASKSLQNELEDRESEELLKDIDAVISGTGEKGKESVSEVRGDPLSGGKWSSRVRKTIFFPDIQSKIPDELKKKGIGYSVTARIRFDRNGLAIVVEIIKSSGNSKIDQIFNTELKKIRVEPVDDNVIDEVVHTFKIRVK